jgi:hypothetical protein
LKKIADEIKYKMIKLWRRQHGAHLGANPLLNDFLQAASKFSSGQKDDASSVIGEAFRKDCAVHRKDSPRLSFFVQGKTVKNFKVIKPHDDGRFTFSCIAVNGSLNVFQTTVKDGKNLDRSRRRTRRS